MPERKYVSLNRLTDYDALIKAEIAEGDANSISSANSYAKSYMDLEVEKLVDGNTTVAKAISATNSMSATKATQDGDGRVISSTYETKTDASTKLTEAKVYTDSIVSTVVKKTGDTMTGYLNFEKTANNVPYKGHIGISNNGNTYITHYSNGTLDNYITLSGNSSYVQRPWNIESGGTGASTSKDARTNLDVYSVDEVDNELAQKAPISHTHSSSDITGLQEQFDLYNEDINNKLSSKAGTNHEHDNYLPISGGDMIGDLNMRNRASVYFLNENDTGAYVSGGYDSSGTPYLEILGTENDEGVTLRSVNIDGYAKNANNADNAISADYSKNTTSMTGVVTSGTGAAYTADVDGMSSLSIGISFIMVPHTVSTSFSPTLNVNGLGAKSIRRRGSDSTVASFNGVKASWLSANKPIRMEYDGNYWVADIMKPVASDISGTLSVPNGGTGLTSVVAGNYLVGNGIENMIEKTPDEVRIHIKSAGKNVEGEEFTITAGVDNDAISVELAEQGAEVFNSYDTNVAIGLYSHAENYGTKAIGNYSHAEGYYTIANDFQHASGKYNEEKPSPATADTQDTSNNDAVFLIGYGTSTTRANAFRVTSGGKCRGASSFSATGADFAELFEWADGNPDNEDRRGLFVALDGDKIKLANANDDYIGVISGEQAFVGNTASEEWQGKYLTDVFGTRLYQEIETPNGTTTQYILNPDYNPSEKYVMRENRKEWDIVGLLGQVVVVDDGTCVVGGYVKPSVNGIGTVSDSGYRVMKRIDETHIKVLVK